MAYTRQTWEDFVTLIDGAKMNHIEDGIYQNAEDITSNAKDISDNKESISTNEKNITSNTSQIEKNAEDISKNAEDISKNAEDISKNAEDIAELSNSLAELDISDQITVDSTYGTTVRKAICTGNIVYIVITATITGTSSTVSLGTISSDYAPKTYSCYGFVQLTTTTMSVADFCGLSISTSGNITARYFNGDMTQDGYFIYMYAI